MFFSELCDLKIKIVLVASQLPKMKRKFEFFVSFIKKFNFLVFYIF